MESKGETKSFWYGYFYTINSIFGSGVLAMPWFYSEGGWLLGVFCQIFISFFSLVLAYHLIQIISRIGALFKLSKSGYTIHPVKFSQIFASTTPEDFIVPE